MNRGLPLKWAECEVGDISTVVGGGTPDTKDPENFSTKLGISWLTPADLSDHEGIYVSRGKRFLTEKGLKSSSARLLPKGTVLFSSRAPIGYVAIASNEISTNQGFKSFVCERGICPEYLYFWLRFAKPLAEELASGTTFAEISGKNASKIPLYLAPFNEQCRIVAKLKVILGKVDACQNRLERIPALLKRFRQAVLAAATSGQLTEDLRNALEVSVNNASTGLLGIPVSWSWVMIGDVGEVKGGKRLPKGEKLVTYNTGFPYIKAGQLKNGTVGKEDQEYLTPHVQRKIQRYIVEKGDVYVTIVGACIGDAGVIPAEYDKANLTENAAKICNLNNVKSEYLAFWLRSPSAQDYIGFLVKSGAQGKLALMRIKEIPVPLPNIPEQLEIIRRVETLFAFADQIEKRYKKAKAHTDRLTQSILAKAFRGELVPQDPNDEPASVLLDRIRQEKARNAEIDTKKHRRKPRKNIS